MARVSFTGKESLAFKAFTVKRKIRNSIFFVKDFVILAILFDLEFFFCYFVSGWKPRTIPADYQVEGINSGLAARNYEGE